MRVLARIFLASMSVCVCASQALAVEYKVVLMGGQSNMDGRASASSLPPSLQAPQSDVKLFYSSITNNNISSYSLPSSWTALSPQAQGGSSFGPEITFGRAMADASPAANYALIKYARGGTSLAADWKPGTGADYTNFRNTVAAGLQAITNGGDTYSIVGMCWLQGESDTGAAATAYQSNLSTFISDVRGRYGANLPFIIGGIGYSGSNYDTILGAGSALAASTPNVRFFDNSDLNNRSSLHFNAAGQQAIGQRYATALQSVPEPTGLLSLALAGGASLLVRRRRGGAVRA